MAIGGTGGGLRAAIEAQLDALSPRDRKLLMGLVTFVSLVTVFFLVMSLSNRLEDHASRVRQAKSNLDLIYAMQVEYNDAARRIEQAEERLRGRDGQRLSAYMERITREQGLSDSLASVTEQNTEIIGGMRQTQHRVELRRITLDAAVRLLHELETSGFLSVELARFRTITLSGEKQLDLTLELTAYALVEGD